MARPKYHTATREAHLCQRCLRSITVGTRYRYLKGEDGQRIRQHLEGECPK